jgi:hypothetical protein
MYHRAKDAASYRAFDPFMRASYHGSGGGERSDRKFPSAAGSGLDFASPADPFRKGTLRNDKCRRALAGTRITFAEFVSCTLF